MCQRREQLPRHCVLQMHFLNTKCIQINSTYAVLASSRSSSMIQVVDEENRLPASRKTELCFGHGSYPFPDRWMPEILWHTSFVLVGSDSGSFSPCLFVPNWSKLIDRLHWYLHVMCLCGSDSLCVEEGLGHSIPEVSLVCCLVSRSATFCLP